ncbi:MAG TPA: hypothetical protein VHT52_02165 [Stellaceae bacterium]|nr:hypothetical protein [Stellaceae bacterium]
MFIGTSDRLHGKIAGKIAANVEEVAMLKGKTRIPPVDVETLPDDLRETLEEQRKLWGAPLYPYLFYARNPGYFRAGRGCGPPYSKRRSAYPVRSGGCSTVASPGGTAASFDRTPMLP